MFTLTITCETTQGLLEIVKSLPPIGVAVHPATPIERPKEAKKKSEPIVPSADVFSSLAPAHPELKIEPQDAPIEDEVKVEPPVTYDLVKANILEVAKKLGRESSLDLLSPFGVVKGEGAERKGNMNDLKPEQYADVIAKAKEMLL